MIVKPCKLRPGSTIGLVAPAGPCFKGDILKKGIEAIENIGFKVVLGRAACSSNGYLAGNDDERAKDINEFFYDDRIDGVFCLRGGYGTLRIIDKIDYKIIRKNPKVFVGYSDITALHISINKMCGMVTFHGPMVCSDFGRNVDNYTESSFLRAVTISRPYGELVNPPKHGEIKALVPGSADGKVMGGNLSVIMSMIGTPYEIDMRKAILCIEEIGEEPYRIDRMLTQLILGRKLQECSGIVLGQWTDCYPEDPVKSLSLLEVFEDRLKPLGIPVLYNAAFGHDSSKLTIPFGVKGKITDDEKFIITEEGVV